MSGDGWVCVDGDEAAARVAHRLSEVVAIYPITPASPMGELANTWSAAGRPNVWGQVPEVVELQSENGAAVVEVRSQPGAPVVEAPKGDRWRPMTQSRRGAMRARSLARCAGEA